MRARRGAGWLMGVLGALVLGTAAAAAPSPTLKPLSARDADAYRSAFAAVRRGEFETAQSLGESIKDPLLQGRLGFARLMHADYRARYDELAAWLKSYRDQPDAMRVYTLAKRRRPVSAPDPERPTNDEDGAADWARVETQAERIEAAASLKAPVRATDAQLQAAREAFYAGDVKKAHTLAGEAGERWIAGLAAYRLKRYAEALERFSAVAQDPAEGDWTRSAAAFWAARASIAAGQPAKAPHWLHVAAETPYTFYGLIAEKQLGLEPAVSAAGLDLGAGAARKSAARSSSVAAPSSGALTALVKRDVRARRAAGLVQVGLKAEAGQEIREAMLGANAADRRLWLALAIALGAPVSSPADLAPQGRTPRFDIAQYPTPELKPQGGFTQEKALVYALVRQESKFRADATSTGGAYGLMQLTPATAARVAGDDKLKTDPRPLKDPAINLKLGQDYVERLLGAMSGDLLHAVAAYNAGPGVLQKTLKQMGSEADSLLAIESMPGAQTRDFVERVVAGYWIYRNIFGQSSETLAAAAAGAKAVAAALDR